ncbi:MAG: hypothetical protein ABFS86_09685 [Planctomycetota bacterium]
MTIETKLIVGRHIELIAPAQTNNGVAVGGFQRLNPVPLSIDESKFWSRIKGPRKSTVGHGHFVHASKAHRNYQWLEWRPGMVSEVVHAGVDVLTGPMSGCWIIRYTRLGVVCVGHVGTDSTPTNPNSVAAKAAWNTFRPTAVGPVTGFNPLRDWPGALPAMNNQTDNAPKIFGLVTGAGAFYSLFTYPQKGTTNTVRIAGLSPIASTLPLVI